MIRTRAGYAGGKKPNPDYGHLGDHTETVQIDYDPRRITYKDLLRIFWKSHRPGQRSWNRQYMNAVFYHNEAQRRQAEATQATVQEQTDGAVHTQVLPLRAFYRAEDYHQKYLLKRRSDLAKVMARIYPLFNDYVDSTAVARLNGYVGGYGNKDQLAQEIENLGLSMSTQKKLLELVGK